MKTEVREANGVRITIRVVEGRTTEAFAEAKAGRSWFFELRPLHCAPHRVGPYKSIKTAIAAFMRTDDARNASEVRPPMLVITPEIDGYSVEIGYNF